MSSPMERLKKRLERIARLGEAGALLDWDQQTYMPPGAADARAEQSAVLGEFVHELFTADETGALLAASEAETRGADPDSDDIRMLAVLRRDYEREIKVPAELVREKAHHASLAQSEWVKARRADDFPAFAPYLEKMMDIVRRYAECLGYTDHIYDALLDGYEPGMKHAQVAQIFAEMRPKLVDLVQRIAASDRPVEGALLHGDYPIDKQKQITLAVVKALGYDLNRGRQDEVEHPFCTSFSRDDVRITTKFDPNYLSQALYASIHEAGHAMYEQGIPARYDSTPLSGGVSLGVHESQSRLWENMVGRSRPFCGWILPKLKEAFPQTLAGCDTETYYRAVNRVQRSLVRIEADEVTYNLHILMRFELESELLTGSLAVKELPAAWAAKMKEYLGIDVPDNAHGVLQDVHWSAGLIGYFPTYTLGNLLSAQWFHSAQLAAPNLNEEMARGNFEPLLTWLRENVHAYGRKYLPGELIERGTGEPLTAKYFTAYLEEKYSEIYAL